ncbi:MAG: hypothetical protein IKT46_01015 [Clostridia bacterium]|nr:hypothetical protein [Clostridia bacterium]
MKRIIAAVLCIITVLTLTACGGSSDGTKPADNYNEVISKLSDIVDAMFTKDFEQKVAEGAYPAPTGEHTQGWTDMLLDATKDFKNVDKNAFGYKLIDINSDGIPELFFMRSDDKILAIFTTSNGAPVLVDAFDRVYQCVIRDTGEVYTLNFREEDGGYDYRIHTLNPSSGGYYTTVSFGLEGSISYEMIDGATYTTSSDRIAELTETYEFKMAEAITNMSLSLF